MPRSGGPPATFTWKERNINGSEQALLSVVFFDIALAGITFGLFFIGVFVARLLGRQASFSPGPLGFVRPRGGAFAAAGLGFLVGLGAVVVSAAVRVLSTRVFESLGYSTKSNVQQPFIEGLVGWIGDNPYLAIPATVFVVVILGPAVEELVFRGAIFNGLNRMGGLVFANLSGAKSSSVGSAKWISFSVAALLSSALFAALHFEPVLLPALLLLALALCWLFQRTNSLLPSFVAHATFNSFTVILVILSGLGVVPNVS